MQLEDARVSDSNASAQKDAETEGEHAGGHDVIARHAPPTMCWQMKVRNSVAAVSAEDIDTALQLRQEHALHNRQPQEWWAGTAPQAAGRNTLV